MYKKAIIILCFICLSLTINNHVQASNNSSTTTNIAIIDIKKVLSSSLAAKSILDDLNNKMVEYQSEIDTNSKALQTEQELLKEQSAVLTKDAISEKQQKIFHKLQLLEKDVAKKKENLQSAYIKTLQEIEQKIIAIVQDISKKNDYNIVLTKENLLYYQNLTDISEKVVNLLNKQLPKIELSIE